MPWYRIHSLIRYEIDSRKKKYYFCGKSNITKVCSNYNQTHLIDKQDWKIIPHFSKDVILLLLQIYYLAGEGESYF